MENNDLDLDHFKQILEAHRADLTALDQSVREAADTVELDQTRQGRLSRMDALQQQAMANESNRRRTLELNRIEAALRRIEQGEFGECRHCGEPIATGRLEADPTASLCVACAEAAEHE
jgi:DnaK suppressor protein